MKNLKVQKRLFLLLAVILSGCAKMPVYNSQKISAEQSSVFNKSETPYESKKQQIQFNFSDDGKSVFLKTVFRDRESMMKIMRGGLFIYFDPDGKKHKEYSIHIERDFIRKPGEGTADFSTVRPENRAQNMPTMIASVFNNVTWNKNGKVLSFNRNLVHEPVSVDLFANDLNQLVLVLSMPISELPELNAEKLFSVGIETKSISGSQGGAGMRAGGTGMRPGGGGMRSGGNMGSRGGMRPGGAGGAGGMRGPGASQGGAMRAGAEPLQLWFQVQL